MQRDTQQLQSTVFDMAVVGGGVHGAWIALRAAQAGYRVALVEKGDFGAATSSNSLSILHGGLRYLQHLDFRRMRASIRARREFGRQFPHLTQPLPCVMPLAPAGVRSPWVLGPALLANDLISWDRNDGVRGAVQLPRGTLVGAAGVGGHLAPLTGARPVAGAIWWDALALDAPRLSFEPVAAAARAGAVVANRVQALAYLMQDRAVAGVAVRDLVSGHEFAVHASVVVNATGPWAGDLSAVSALPQAWMPRWVGGLNLVLRRSLGIGSAVALSSESRTADASALLRRANRELFFVPWRGVTTVGTDYHHVDSVAQGAEGPPATAVEDFVAEIDRVAPRACISTDDVALVHWGLLPADASGAMPRKSPIVVTGRDATGADGLVIVIGEKLTSAPILSERVLALAARQLARPGRPDPTRGDAAGVVAASAATTPAVGESAAARLASRYGDCWPDVARCADGRAELLERIHPDGEALGVEVVHAVRHEMALGLDDVVLRRLGIGIAGHPGARVIERCAALVAAELRWQPTDTDRAVKALDAWYSGRSRLPGPSGRAKQ